MTQLTQEQFDRIDRALGLVINNVGDFTDFQVDFAMTNADRLDRHGLDTSISDKQWAQIEKIEARAREAGLNV